MVARLLRPPDWPVSHCAAISQSGERPSPILMPTWPPTRLCIGVKRRVTLEWREGPGRQRTEGEPCMVVKVSE